MHFDGYRRGIELFNQRKFFDAHEVWEDVWRETIGPRKKFLQGLIQVAVAFHHHSTGNVVGACSLMERGRRNLEKYPEHFLGIRVEELRAALVRCRARMLSDGSLPEFPKIDVPTSAQEMSLP